MRYIKINGSNKYKQKVKKYRPVVLKPTKFSKNKVLSSCNQVIVQYGAENKVQTIVKIISCPLKQHKSRKILTKSAIVQISTGKSVKIKSRVRHDIPHAEPI